MLPGCQLATSRCRENLAVLVNHFSAADRDNWPASHLPTGKDRELAVRQNVLILYLLRQVGIPNHHVGIGPDRDRALAGVETKQLGRIR